MECVEEFAAGGVVEEFGVGVFGDGGGGVAEQFADDSAHMVFAIATSR